jgi:uncharacterized protein YdaU (DUF1376 family)
VSAPPYMKLFWGDYHKATRHLTTAQHGAYLLLIGEAWRLGGSLPDDDAMLAHWTRCTKAEWTKIKPVVMAFFAKRRGKFVHDRVREELAHYESISRKRKSAGQAGGNASAGNHEGNPTANATQLPTKPKPESKKKEDLGSGETRSRARSPEGYAAALVKGFPRLATPPETPTEMAARLRRLA